MIPTQSLGAVTGKGGEGAVFKGNFLTQVEIRLCAIAGGTFEPEHRRYAKIVEEGLPDKAVAIPKARISEVFAPLAL